jgi:hypothetical protein
MGHLVAAMRKKKVESFGFDFSQYAIENAVVDSRRYVRTASLLDDWASEPNKQFDLVTCVEVIEHIPEEHVDQAINALCSFGKVIYFSSEDNHDEPTHVNPQPLAYWRNKFSERGYVESRSIFNLIPWGRSFVKAESYTQLRDLLDADTRGRVLMRDDFSCLMCGKRGVQVHEIIPRSAFGKRSMEECYEEKNRVCLCPEHHATAHTFEMRKSLLDMMSSKYGYVYSELIYQKYTE